MSEDESTPTDAVILSQNQSLILRQTQTLVSQGFRRAGKEPPRRRLIASIDGAEKTGKTHLCLSAPGPIFYQDCDIGTEGMIERILENRHDIFHHKYEWVKDMRKAKQNVKEAVYPIFYKFMEDYYKALDSSLKPGGFRTIVWDNGADLWQMCLLAHLGKDVQIQPQERTQANDMFRSMIRTAMARNANLLITHPLVPDFEDARLWKRDRAFNKIAFLVQAAIQCKKKRERDGSKVFEYEITVCRHNTLLEGEVLDGGGVEKDGTMIKGMKFANVAAFITGSSAKEWR